DDVWIGDADAPQQQPLAVEHRAGIGKRYLLPSISRAGGSLSVASAAHAALRSASSSVHSSSVLSQRQRPSGPCGRRGRRPPSIARRWPHPAVSRISASVNTVTTLPLTTTAHTRGRSTQ